MVIRGFRLAIGSWKIICTRRRSGFKAPPGTVARSTPPAPGCRLGVEELDAARRRASARRMHRATVVLPLPLSPTRPSVSPRRRSRSTRSTAAKLSRGGLSAASGPCVRTCDQAAESVRRLDAVTGKRFVNPRTVSRIGASGPRSAAGAAAAATVVEADRPPASAVAALRSVRGGVVVGVGGEEAAAAGDLQQRRLAPGLGDEGHPARRQLRGPRLRPDLRRRHAVDAAEQPTRVRVQRPAVELVDRGDLHHAAAAHHRDLVGDLRDHAQVVGDEQDARVGLLLAARGGARGSAPAPSRPARWWARRR